MSATESYCCWSSVCILLQRLCEKTGGIKRSSQFHSYIIGPNASKLSPGFSPVKLHFFLLQKNTMVIRKSLAAHGAQGLNCVVQKRTHFILRQKQYFCSVCLLLSARLVLKWRCVVWCFLGPLRIVPKTKSWAADSDHLQLGHVCLLTLEVFQLFELVGFFP